MLITRIAAIGDVHGHAGLLKRAIGSARSWHADLVVCVGDIAGYPDATSHCCELLSTNRITSVRGNHDRWFLESVQRDQNIASSVSRTAIQYLSDLPTSVEFETTIGLGTVFHGVGANDLASFPTTFLEPFLQRMWRLSRLRRDYRLIINGHSHEQLVRTHGELMIASVGPLCGDATTGCLGIDLVGRATTPIRYS